MHSTPHHPRFSHRPSRKPFGAAAAALFLLTLLQLIAAAAVAQPLPDSPVTTTPAPTSGPGRKASAPGQAKKSLSIAQAVASVSVDVGAVAPPARPTPQLPNGVEGTTRTIVTSPSLPTLPVSPNAGNRANNGNSNVNGKNAPSQQQKNQQNQQNRTTVIAASIGAIAGLGLLAFAARRRISRARRPDLLPGPGASVKENVNPIILQPISPKDDHPPPMLPPRAPMPPPVRFPAILHMENIVATKPGDIESGSSRASLDARVSWRVSLKSMSKRLSRDSKRSSGRPASKRLSGGSSTFASPYDPLRRLSTIQYDGVSISSIVRSTKVSTSPYPHPMILSLAGDNNPGDVVRNIRDHASTVPRNIRAVRFRSQESVIPGHFRSPSWSSLSSGTSSMSSSSTSSLGLPTLTFSEMSWRMSFPAAATPSPLRMVSNAPDLSESKAGSNPVLAPPPEPLQRGEARAKPKGRGHARARSVRVQQPDDLPGSLPVAAPQPPPLAYDSSIMQEAKPMDIVRPPKSLQHPSHRRRPGIPQGAFPTKLGDGWSLGTPGS